MNDTPYSSDEPTPEELAAASTIRPLAELPSNWTVKGNPAVLSKPTLSALSSADQQTVRERAGDTSEAAINQALMGFLRERSAEARIRGGAGQGASASEHTALEQMNTLRLLSEETARIDAELADVLEHRTEYVDGRPTAVPVYRHNGDARTAREARLSEIQHQMALVAGIEGEKELLEARRADALRAREVRQQFDEAAEAKALAAKMLRDERVQKRAEGIAKHQRSSQ